MSIINSYLLVFFYSANEESVETDKTQSQNNDADGQDYHRSDEQVNICLEGRGVSMRNLKRKFIRCSSQATIMQLKKFIALKVFNSAAKHTDVSIEFDKFIKNLQHIIYIYIYIYIYMYMYVICVFYIYIYIYIYTTTYKSFE